MAITLNCPKCSKPFRVRDDVIGMRVKCPNCQAILQVPSAISPASLLISDVPPEPMDEPQPSLLNAPMPNRPIIPGHRPNLATQPRMGGGVEEDVRTTFENHPETHKPATMPPMGQMRTPQSQPETPQRSMLPNQNPMNAPALAPVPAPATTNYVGDFSPMASGAWKRVKAGIGYCKFGMYLLLIPAITEIARLYVLENYPEKMNPDKPGFLKLGAFNFWDDIRLLTIAVPAVLGFLLILLGRTVCLSAPSSSRTSRLAFASLLCTLVSIGGIALCAYVFLMPKIGQSGPLIEPKWQWAGAGLGLVFGIVAEVWFCLFQGQVGFVLGFPTIQRQIGIAAMLIALTAFGILAADAFHPFLNVDAKQHEIDQVEEIMKSLNAEEEPLLSGDKPKEETKLAPIVPLTTREKAKDIEEKAKAKAKKYLEEGKSFVTNRRILPTLALYGFCLVFILSMQSVSSSTRGVIRRWTGLHPAM